MATKSITVRQCVGFRMAAQSFPILPVRAAFKLGVIGSAIGPIVDSYLKQRSVIMKKYGIQEPKGAESVALTPEAEAEVNTLLDTPQDVSYTPIAVEDFIDPHGGSATRDVSPALMTAVGMFFDLTA